MFSRSVLRVATRSVRSYATEAETPAGLIKLALTLPHQTIFKSTAVKQVNIAAESGDMVRLGAGSLANHIASIESLKPGVLEVIEQNGDSKKWFVSGGFANVHANNTLTVNAVEAYPLEAFSVEAIRSGLAEAQRVVSGNGDEVEKAEAAIEVSVFEALQAAVKA
ncbi:ATP synthase F1, epsilon subunit [Pseudohyphozyma bogoriensis]|nr:ATP synthase F1, epsilon subunit [Pseudohyphozyma bogoriensis]